ncbi:MAG: DUF1697 domain-containing protein [Gemmatimonadales bacterium]|jgi:uncharacterized protein (DUF1697 family)
MTCFVFLRAINVGGHRVTMDELRGLFADLGFPDADTFLASGNVILDVDAEAPAEAEALERRIETGLEEALGYEVATFLRADDELRAVADAVPEHGARIANPQAVNVAFLRAPLDAKQRDLLRALETEIDEFHLDGRHLYWLCGTRQSDSTFSNASFERKLQLQATFRGLNTVRRLLKKYA